jgi:hypothetical protein
LIAALLVLLALPSPAPAGVPFGGDDPGCLPDGKPAAQCADGATKALAKLVASVVTCHRKQADAQFKHASFDEEACEQTDPAKSAGAKFDASLAKLAARCPGTPIVATAGAVAGDLLADAPAAGSLETLAGAVYCDPSSGIPLDLQGDDPGFVPIDQNALKCADGVTKGLGKLAGAVLTCHRKMVVSGLKGGPTDDEACETAAQAKFEAVTQKLVANGGCPACLDPGSQNALADAIVAFVEQATGQLYPCPVTTTSTSTTTSSSSSTTSSTSTSIPTTTSTSSSSTTSTSTSLPTTTSTSSTSSTSSTTTSSSTSSSTTTSTSSSTTTSTMATCSAGGTVPFSVHFSVPDSSVIVQGLTLLVDYPETVVHIGTPTGTFVVKRQAGTLVQPTDLGSTGLSVNDAGTSHPIDPTQSLFTVNFTCAGTTTPTAADFPCTVQSAVDPLAQPDQGVTCFVTSG